MANINSIMINACLVVAVIGLSALLSAHAGDPNILSDFMVPADAQLNADLFTFRGFRKSLWGEPTGAAFKLTKASLVEFPILEGLSVSLAVLQFAPGGVNAPHTHPRASEFLLVLQGSLNVGFVDSANKLFIRTLETGECFLFPKGLVHFQINADSKYPATAVSAFGSANPGRVSLPNTLFASGIDAAVLAKSFKIDTHTINKLIWANRMA